MLLTSDLFIVPPSAVVPSLLTQPMMSPAKYGGGTGGGRCESSSHTHDTPHASTSSGSGRCRVGRMETWRLLSSTILLFRFGTKHVSFFRMRGWGGSMLWMNMFIESVFLTNSAHDTGVVSEGERREIAHRNRWCDFRPATARTNPSERHIGRPKPAICEASVSSATMTDILESSYRRTQSQPIGGSMWRLPE